VKSVAHSFLDAIVGDENWPTALKCMADCFGGIETHFAVWDRARCASFCWHTPQITSCALALLVHQAHSRSLKGR
jgi:hypothetical protein